MKCLPLKSGLRMPGLHISVSENSSGTQTEASIEKDSKHVNVGRIVGRIGWAREQPRCTGGLMEAVLHMPIKCCSEGQGGNFPINKAYETLIYFLFPLNDRRRLGVGRAQTYKYKNTRR